MTYIQPCLLLGGAFDFSAFVRRVVQRRNQSRSMIPTYWFHVTVALDASRLRSYASPTLALVPTIILCEARGLWLFWVIPRGIGLTRRLGADVSTRCLMSAWILSLEPERRRTDGPPFRHEKPVGSLGVLCNAQASCVFSSSASKRSSFFQSVKAMAAIFLANVRRAISGFMPLSSKVT